MGVGTVRDRLLTLYDVGGCASWREVDRLVGLRENMSRAYVRDVEPKVPQYSTATKLAATFGVDVEWLLAGRGDAPGERRVRRAVAAARERVEGRSKRAAGRPSAPTGAAR